MIGLRTKVSVGFKCFFEKVQSEASKKDCIFYFDTQESIETIVAGCECMVISGWMIPKEKAERFNMVYNNFNEDAEDEWDDYIAWVTWKEHNGIIQINIELL